MRGIGPPKPIGVHAALTRSAAGAPNHRQGVHPVHTRSRGCLCTGADHYGLKGKGRGGLIISQGGGDPPDCSNSNQDISQSFWSYPKSFRIWSSQTDVASGFQWFWVKRSHLGEIVVESWKLGGEFSVFTGIHKGAPLCTN